MNELQATFMFFVRKRKANIESKVSNKFPAIHLKVLFDPFSFSWRSEVVLSTAPCHFQNSLTSDLEIGIRTNWA